MVAVSPSRSKGFPRRAILLFLGALVLAGRVLTGSAFSADAAPQVTIKTNLGDIVVELDAAKAPITVANFLKYVTKGHYNGTIFHRVIDNFMIQGGGFDEKGGKKETDGPIKNEAGNGLRNEPYTIAMARLGDPNSATAQFFINVNNNTALDYPGRDGSGYCVFGKVVTGKDVVDKIKSVATANKGGAFTDAPVTPVVIESATSNGVIPNVVSMGTGSSANQASIEMLKDHGILRVPVQLNGAITLKFVVDSGATYVQISKDVFATLVRAETIKEADFLPGSLILLADGSKVKSDRFILRSLKVGDTTVSNVEASVSNSDATLLLGQSFLSRFAEWKIDNQRNKLILVK